jgi:ketosteroid isomerase-like protein
MMKHFFSALLCSATLFSCSTTAEKKVDIATEIAELERLETAFKDSTALYGYNKAMLFFAADDAVFFKEGDNILNTIDSMKAKAAKIPPGAPPPPYTLNWKADKIEVSSSGDMAFTWGHFQFKQKDETGKEQVTKGLYSTIWKKVDGKWKVAMD